MKVSAALPKTAPTVAAPAVPPSTLPAALSGRAVPAALAELGKTSAARLLTSKGVDEVATLTQPGVAAIRHCPRSLRNSQLATAQSGVSTRNVCVTEVPGPAQPTVNAPTALSAER